MAKRILSVIAGFKEAGFIQFFVEELRPNGKFRRIPRVGGPYATYDEALAVAVAHSKKNGVKTRVVAEQ
jgi:hypothetical protein